MKREEVVSVLRTHQADLDEQGVKGLALFGSVARGDSSRKSDVDLLVEFSRPVGLLEFVHLKLSLEKWLGCKVDLVTPDALHPAMRTRILGEAVNVC